MFRSKKDRPGQAEKNALYQQALKDLGVTGLDAIWDSEIYKKVQKRIAEIKKAAQGE